MMKICMYLPFRGKMSSKVEVENGYNDVDDRVVTPKLVELGATKIGTFLFKTQNYKPNEVGMELYRVRDEGFRVTVGKKYKNPDNPEYQKEVEVEVDAFEPTIEKLVKEGAVKTFYMEKVREIYEVDGCEVVFDYTPGMVTRLEIEGKCETLEASQEAVKALNDKLGLTPEPFVRGAMLRLTKEKFGIKSVMSTWDIETTFENIDDKYLPLLDRENEEGCAAFMQHVERQRGKLEEAMREKEARREELGPKSACKLH